MTGQKIQQQETTLYQNQWQSVKFQRKWIKNGNMQYKRQTN